MTGWENFIHILSWVLIVSGTAFIIIGAIGLVRFPDFWSRLHAVSVLDSGGMILLVAGMGIQAGFSLIAFKLLAIGVFLIVTGPTATHAIANAAYIAGDEPPKLKSKEKKKKDPK